MDTIKSRITAQGQISVPAEVRRKLGVGPGSIIEWEENGDEIVVKRAAVFKIEDLHRRVFPDGSPSRKSLTQIKEGIQEYTRNKHARR